MAKVTGIGGVFFLANDDNDKLSKWYQEHLGISLEEWGGGVLEWKNDQAEDGGTTVWHVADANSEWFSPSTTRFMINYRVDDLEKLIEQLNNADIQVLKGPEYHENGVFAWLLDPEGNKLELWEPKRWDEKISVSRQIDATPNAHRNPPPQFTGCRHLHNRRTLSPKN